MPVGCLVSLSGFQECLKSPGGVVLRDPARHGVGHEDVAGRVDRDVGLRVEVLPARDRELPEELAFSVEDLQAVIAGVGDPDVPGRIARRCRRARRTGRGRGRCPPIRRACCPPGRTGRSACCRCRPRRGCPWRRGWRGVRRNPLSVSTKEPTNFPSGLKCTMRWFQVSATQTLPSRVHGRGRRARSTARSPAPWCRIAARTGRCRRRPGCGSSSCPRRTGSRASRSRAPAAPRTGPAPSPARPDSLAAGMTAASEG